MKKLEKKKEEVKEPETPVVETVPTPVKVVKEKPDYTWVWILIGLLATMGTIYFMNVDAKKKDDGNPPA